MQDVGKRRPYPMQSKYFNWNQPNLPKCSRMMSALNASSSPRLEVDSSWFGGFSFSIGFGAPMFSYLLFACIKNIGWQTLRRCFFYVLLQRKCEENWITFRQASRQVTVPLAKHAVVFIKGHTAATHNPRLITRFSVGASRREARCKNNVHTKHGLSR